MTDYPATRTTPTDPDGDEVVDQDRHVEPVTRERFPAAEGRPLLPCRLDDCPECARRRTEADCCFPAPLRQPEGGF